MVYRLYSAFVTIQVNRYRKASFLFHPMEQFVPTYGTTCSKPWNNLYQALEQSIPGLGTKHYEGKYAYYLVDSK